MKAVSFVFILIFLLQIETGAEPQNRAPAQESYSGSVDSISADGKSRIRTKKIKHPGAKDGLYLIDEEGVYHYRVQNTSKKDNALFIKVVSQTTPEIYGETDAGTFSFDDMYGVSEMLGVEFIYEWQPFKQFGKSGVQLGLGLTTASGKGYFKSADTSLEGKTPRESYTFFSVPVSAGVIYRFEYGERQWFVPYLAGGLLYNGLLEYRNDGDISASGAFGAYGSGGLLVNLTAFNKELAFKMDREYGFSQLWLMAEFKRTQSFQTDLDITSNQISVGIGADY